MIGRLTEQSPGWRIEVVLQQLSALWYRGMRGHLGRSIRRYKCADGHDVSTMEESRDRVSIPCPCSNKGVGLTCRIFPTSNLAHLKMYLTSRETVVGCGTSTCAYSIRKICKSSSSCTMTKRQWRREIHKASRYRNLAFEYVDPWA